MMPLLPMPEFVLSVIYKFVFTTFHGQSGTLPKPVALLTVTKPVSEFSLCIRPTGVSAMSQFVPHCVTVNNSPATSIFPERRPGTRFSATE